MQESFDIHPEKKYNRGRVCVPVPYFLCCAGGAFMTQLQTVLERYVLPCLPGMLIALAVLTGVFFFFARCCAAGDASSTKATSDGLC